jgi:flagellar hook assembly protein FlgD
MRISAIITLTFLLIFSGLKAQTDGSVTFTIKTIAKSGGFSPKHVLAIWIEDNSGKLVKNLELSANTRKQYLYTWNTVSGGSATDITTGATLTSHKTHSKTWDCRDKSGTLVPDGSYKIRTEFTSEHAQGPLDAVTFTKASGAITLNPAASTYFTDINLAFTPSIGTKIDLLSPEKYELEVYPNPVKDFLNIVFTMNTEAKINLSIYNMNIQLVSLINESIAVEGNNEFRWSPPSDLVKGSYILILQSDKFIATRKIVFTE